MLYTETVESGTLELLKILMQDSKFSDFLLAGGTNLALRGLTYFDDINYLTILVNGELRELAEGSLIDKINLH